MIEQMKQTIDELFMKRALELARLGEGRVSPNPMVGCVIVHDNQIIGEGWHSKYGGPHAEVEAVRNAIFLGNENVLKESTAYVTLEPCAHFGKTPPCADLLVKYNLKRVVICNHDTNPLVGGKGISKLVDANIEVITGVLEEEGRCQNRRFFYNLERKLPYIVIKWAETQDGFISQKGGIPLAISNQLVNILVHRWRVEEDAILVGKNTVLSDDPTLNVRNWTGKNPKRIVLDSDLELAGKDLKVLNDGEKTFLINRTTENGTEADAVQLISVSSMNIRSILENLYSLGVRSILVEGGAKVIASFVESGLWNEIRVVKGTMRIDEGIAAPKLNETAIRTDQIGDNLIHYYVNS